MFVYKQTQSLLNFRILIKFILNQGNLKVFGSLIYGIFLVNPNAVFFFVS